MRSIALFKWAKWDHKMFTLYYNPKADDQYKGYLVMNFANTKVTAKAKNGKDVWVFKDCPETNFGINISSSLDELGTFMRYLARDKSIWKEEHKNKEKGGQAIPLLHKQWTSDKTVYLAQYATGWHYISIVDRNNKVWDKAFSVMIPLSSSEMYILQQYALQVLYWFRQEYGRENPKLQGEEEAAVKWAEAATTENIAKDILSGDDDLPF